MRRAITVLIALAMVLSACGSGDESVDEPVAATTTTQTVESTIAPEPTTTPAPTTTSDEETTTVAAGEPTEGVTVEVVATELGDVLADDEGFILYVFDPDEQGASVCYDQCEATWPPLVAEVTVGSGVDEALIGSAERTDGTIQVTYNGSPLYYFASAVEAGDTNGQGVGDVWWVVDPAGEAVR